jgi:hypothetical protein
MAAGRHFFRRSASGHNQTRGPIWTSDTSKRVLPAHLAKISKDKRFIKTANINAKNLQFPNAVNGAIVTPQKQQI